jgi:DNA-binding MarR family transcriptional regulator
MTVLLNNMEKQDLIRKEAKLVSGGKRAYCIYLTEKGKEIAGRKQ